MTNPAALIVRQASTRGWRVFCCLRVTARLSGSGVSMPRKTPKQPAWASLEQAGLLGQIPRGFAEEVEGVAMLLYPGNQIVQQMPDVVLIADEVVILAVPPIAWTPIRISHE